MSDIGDPAATGSGGPAAAGKRIGNGEREAAVAALKTHHSHGRLNSQEYEDRALRAREARTWADLDPLFTDLPEPHPVPGVIPPLSAPPAQPVAPNQPAGSVAGPVPGQVAGPATAAEHRGSLIPEPWAAWLMSLTPFAALIIFFITDDWQWFLAIPIAGIIIYGPDGTDGHRHRDRDRRRNR